jgi:hypothetical protein
VPQPGWIDAAQNFIQTGGLTERFEQAGIFRLPGPANLRPGFGELVALLRAAIAGSPKPEQGLIIARRLYEAIGGHPAGDDAEAVILRRLGRQRLTLLPAAVTLANT